MKKEENSTDVLEEYSQEIIEWTNSFREIDLEKL